MKTLLIILLSTFSASAQLQSFVVRGDTVYSFNPSTGVYVQMNKVPVSVTSDLVATALGYTPTNDATNTGGWTTLRVSGSNATTTGQVLTDITGLVSGTLANGSLYEVEAVLYVTTTSVTTGCQYAITAGGTGAAAEVFAVLNGTTTTNAATTVTQAASGTQIGTFLTTSGASGIVTIKGFVKTRGSGTANISIQHLKVTSGTSTVKIGSVFRYRLIN